MSWRQGCHWIACLALCSVPVQNTMDITVMVTDCNDNKPIFAPITYTARCEGDSVNSTAASFIVTDGDQDTPNSLFDVEIVPGTNGPLMGGEPPFKLVDVSGLCVGGWGETVTPHSLGSIINSMYVTLC